FIIGTTYLTYGLLLGSFIAFLVMRKKKANILLNIGLLLLCLGVVHGTDYVVNHVLKPYQSARILAVFHPEDYANDVAYQTMNSLKAIGHGGFSGRGYLQGELTQLELVPEQFTDFIFCTIGEEHGWLGATFVIGLYLTFLIRIVLIAERQNAVFARVYGYSVASIFFFHFLINIGMEIGFLPVIGIPLPLLSYGGSSLLAFTILIFILLKLDMHRSETFARV
ncbi:MAG: rod shape-determining protein RodA, partial [Cellulophaga sp.]|nr:rod shape-determining protein RodA [Cellulophaga sp.]